MHCIVQSSMMHYEVQGSFRRKFAKVQMRPFRRRAAQRVAGGDRRGGRAPVPGTGLRLPSMDELARAGTLYNHGLTQLDLCRTVRSNSMSPDGGFHRLLRRTDPSCRQWPMPSRPPSRSALTAATRNQSNLSDDWRRCRRRCPRESIHKTERDRASVGRFETSRCRHRADACRPVRDEK